MKEEAGPEVREHSDVVEAGDARDRREHRVRNNEVVVHLVKACRVARGNDGAVDHFQPTTVGDGARLHVPVASNDPWALKRGDVLGELLKYRDVRIGHTNGVLEVNRDEVHAPLDDPIRPGRGDAMLHALGYAVMSSKADAFAGEDRNSARGAPQRRNPGGPEVGGPPLSPGGVGKGIRAVFSDLGLLGEDEVGPGASEVAASSGGPAVRVAGVQRPKARCRVE